MKIVFLFHVPFEDRFLKSFYVEALMARGHKVEIWSLAKHFGSDLIFGSGSEKTRNMTHELSLAQLEQKLKTESKDILVFPSFASYWGTLQIYRLLKKYRIRTFYIDRGSLPHFQKAQGQLSLFISKLKGFLNSLLGAFQIIKVHDVLFYSGIRKKSGLEIVQINASDYDQYLTEKNPELNLGFPYIVFLDEFMAYHPDFDFLGWPKLNDINYFEQLNGLFEKIEKEVGAKIVIAEHPKASYQSNPFGGRKMIKGNTQNLVKNSEMVVCHASNSIGYAVIFKKKLLFCCTRQMSQLYSESIYSTSKQLADILGAPFLITEEAAESKVIIRETNQAKYAEFQTKYLSAGDGKRKSVEIIEETLFKFGLRNNSEKN